MKNFLRYGSRHMIHFPGDWKLPRLNPIGYSSHTEGGKRTKSFHEPLWAFLLRRRVFGYAGQQRCGRRGDNFGEGEQRFGGEKPLPDTWNIGADSNRTCSYCGSLHFEDLMKIARKTLIDERYGVEGSDKAYKVYVKQPNVRNASQGGIKFYMHHAPENPTPDNQEIFLKAKRITSERFNKQMAEMKAARS